MTPRLERTEMALRRLLALLTAVLATAWIVFYGMDPLLPHAHPPGLDQVLWLPLASVAGITLPWVSVILLWRAEHRTRSGEGGHLPALVRALATGGDGTVGTVGPAGPDGPDDHATTALGLPDPVLGTPDPATVTQRDAEHWAFLPLVIQALIMALVPVFAAHAMVTHDLAAADRAGLISTFGAITGFLAAAAALPTAWCTAYLIAVHALRAVLVFVIPWPSTELAIFSVFQSLAVCLLVLGRGVFLRQIAASVDRALHRAAGVAARAAGRTAATAEAARIDGLVHDHILAALLIASRADHAEDAPMVRRSAAGALAALAEIVAPLHSATAADGELDEAAETATVDDFAAALFAAVHELDPTVTCSGRGHLSIRRTLPPAAATALSAATLEAVRNSLRHAAGGTERPVRRTVLVHVTSTAVTVTVGDDGVGFDPATAPKGRYGVTGSILGRMDGLEGGHAELTTAPGRGTTVTLSFTERMPDERVELPAPPTPQGLLTEFRRTESRSPAIVMGKRLVADAGKDVRSWLPVTAPLGIGVSIAGMAWSGSVAIENDLLSLVAAILSVIACVFVAGLGFRDPAHALPLWFVLLIVPGAPLGIVAMIPAYVGGPDVLSSFWMVTSVYLVILYLAIEAFPISALAVALLSSIILATWGVLGGWPAGLLHGGWPLLFLVSVMVSSYQIASIRSMERAAVLSVGLRSRIDVEARSTAAERARRLNARRVDTLARPLLERLAAGERTGDSVRIEAQLLEARLRDDLRARCFRLTDVTRAAHDARARGVHVELLDDGALDAAPASLRERVFTRTVHALAQASDGAVVVRVWPPGRELVATVVTSPAGAPATRLEIAAGPPDAQLPDAPAGGVESGEPTALGVRTP